MSSQEKLFSKPCDGCGTTIYYRKDLNPAIFVEDANSEEKHSCGLWKPDASKSSFKKGSYSGGYKKKSNFSNNTNQVDWAARDKAKSEQIQELHDETITVQREKIAAIKEQTEAINRLADVLEHRE